MSRRRFDGYHVVSDGDLGRCDEAGGVICPLTYVGGADVDAPRSLAPRTSQLPDFAPGTSILPSARALEDAVVEVCCMNLVVWERYLDGIAEAGNRDDGKAGKRSKER